MRDDCPWETGDECRIRTDILALIWGTLCSIELTHLPYGKILACRAGFEPTTRGLRVRCSTIELPAVPCGNTGEVAPGRCPHLARADNNLQPHKLWSERRDSNPQLLAWKASTLPLSYSRPLTRRWRDWG